ncbi:MAG: DUF512 domain-containing protein [Clostridia bacterium]|nr:DUF512 domain-containing protein [Clostridia bacterium]
MAQWITSVDPRSAAERAGICAGDQLLRINGETVLDFLDYQDLCANRRLELLLRREGREYTARIVKGEYDSLGLNFDKPMMSATRMCCNHCLFCFVDQLPSDVRDTMQVKDDDWRMSLMMGNYVTLTNVSDRELERIIRRHASPLYVSVHATDPALRTELLGTPRAARLMRQLQTLSAHGIEFHCQCVLCPGLNDGEALEQTIRELTSLKGALSLALVPVGLTCHREGRYPLRRYTPEEARAVIDCANRWRPKLLMERGTRFVFPSDEFYLQADAPIPTDEEYEDYGQIDDGVGMLRLLETEFVDSWNELPPEHRRSGEGRRIAVATGISAADFLRDMLSAHPVTGAQVEVYAIENRFFGASVTVAGLITGGDLTDAMLRVDSAAVLITECMLRSDGDCFLDDMTLTEAQRKLGRPIIPVGRRGDDLLNAILRLRAPEKTDDARQDS